VRNVVHSGMLGQLRRQGLEACLITSLADVALAADEWGSEARCVELLPANVIASQRGLAFWNGIIHASFCRRHRVNFLRIYGRWWRRNDRPWPVARHAATAALSLLGCHEPFYSWLIRRRDRRVRRTRDFDPIHRQLAELQPSLLVSTNSQYFEELPYVIAARELGIPTLGCIQSFDNLTTRGILPVFDHYAVWNERMRDQVLRFYPDRDPASIHITGSPQFDFHVRPAYRWSREATLRCLGLGPRDRYVLYAPSGLPSEPDLLDAMARAFAATPLLRDHRIVVRPHPVDDPGRWERAIARDGRLVLNWPWRVMPGLAWDAPGVVRAADQARLVSTLAHADVCLNTASTISLDAAAAGTPVVCVGFAGRRGGREDELCLNAHFTTHYQPITESGGVRLARDMEKLVNAVATYVRDRSQDMGARQRLVAAECGPVDGRAAARVADLIAALSAAGR